MIAFPSRTALTASLLTWGLLLGSGHAQSVSDPAHWIWMAGTQAGQNVPSTGRILLEKRIQLPAAATKAVWKLTADNHFVAFVGEQRVAEGHFWERGVVKDVTRFIHEGEVRLWVVAWNDGGPAGFYANLEVTFENGERKTFGTDRSWQTKAWRDPLDPPLQPASELGAMGVAPWGHRVKFSAAREDFAPRPGFSVQELASGFGSLIALAIDDQDRVYTSTEGGGIWRLEDANGDGTYEGLEPYCTAMSSCQGLAPVAGQLYAVGQGPEGVGLYVIEEDRRDQLRLLGAFKGGLGEHGPHAVVLGPDGRLWITIGNHAQVAAEPSADSPYRIFEEGSLLPTLLDPSGHARDVKAPGGLVLSVDRDGRDWRVVAGGLRNAYDLAFDGSGELFVWDSDMEWDIGLPWYRPTRLYHVVPGAEFGWRTGSSKWPTSYPDVLPPAIEAGRGSPTGLVLYDHSRFPAEFRGKLLGGDWAQGRILAFDLERDGAGFTGHFEVLLSGRPLNVTDLVVTGGGDLLFTTGGRGTRGALYRLRFEGSLDEPAAKQDQEPPELASPYAATRHPAPFHDADWAALEVALSGEDRVKRFLAARALERGEPRIDAKPLRSELGATESFIASVRTGAALPLKLLAIAGSFPSPDHTTRQAALRLLELSLIRSPKGLTSKDAAFLLNDFPCGNRLTDRATSTLIAHTAPKGGLDALLGALENGTTRPDRLHYLRVLSAWPGAWTAEQAERAADFIALAITWTGGVSFEGYIRAMAQAAMKQWPPEVARALQAKLDTPAAKRPKTLRTATRREADRITAFLATSIGAERRDLSEGSRVFSEACAQCHSFAGQGRGVGPDLTTIGGRFSIGDLVESVVHPSRVVSDQYRATELFTLDGLMIGQVLREDDRSITLLLGTGEEESIDKADIEQRRFSQRSAMPEGLLDTLSLEEVGDLFAYLQQGRAVEPSESSPWKPLLNPLTLEGWEGEKGLWSMRGGTLHGAAKDLTKNTFLVSKQRYKDFTLQFELLLEEGNSGLQFRASRAGPMILHGYQADAGHAYWGSLYEEGLRGMLQHAPEVDWRPALDPLGFNHFVVEAHGDRIRITLNGVPTVIYRDPDGASEGHLGFQLHSGDRTAIQVRNLLLRSP